MQASLRTLLSGIIDYAGLFPPAQLPLAAAFANYLRYRDSLQGWLIDKFICPAAQLSELSPLASGEQSVSMSILGRGGKDGAAFFANLREDADLIDAFRPQNPWANIDAFEVRLSADLAADTARHRDIVTQLGRHAPARSVAVEAGLAGDAEGWLPSLLRTLGEAAGEAPRFSFKLRCGGLEAAAFPTVDQVALVLGACRAAGVPVKFTAGLHHPIRHFDVALHTPMHGFINVFVAGILGLANNLDRAELCKILADESPDSFHFDEHALKWQQFAANLHEIAAARRSFVTSFGSCSVDEPVADLHELGWI